MAAIRIALHHDIVSEPTEFESGLGVTTTPERFVEQLDHFEKNYDIIDLETLLNGPLPRKPLLLTFDDCYRSVLDIAEQVLAPRGVPAVLFTNPDLLGPDQPALDNVLSWFEQRHGMPALLKALELEGYTSASDVLSNVMKDRTSTERKTLRDHLMSTGNMTGEDLKDRSPILTHDDLRKLPTLGIEIGNHTASHVHCRALTKAEHITEFAQAKDRLEQICNQPVRSFSVPYGNEADLTPDVLESLRASGHLAIFLVHARSNRFRPAPDVWHRVSLHNEAASQLPRKFEVDPALRSLKKMIGL